MNEKQISHGAHLAIYHRPIVNEYVYMLYLQGWLLLFQNVHANQLLVERYGYPVHVPPAPNDCGISVGSAWIIQP